MTPFKLWLSFLMTLPSIALAAEQTIDKLINNTVAPITDKVTQIIFYSVNIAGANLPIIVVWLIIGALFFTIYFKFINLRAMGHAFSLIRGKHAEPDAPGEVSHFQALATAVSGTVGLGNIAGVAIAISVGGPGATFWMILAGLLGMSTKFVECTLGVKYRKINDDGTVSGGPMYYLSQGLKEKGFGIIGPIIAVFFAICCIGGALGGGNMFQANQAFEQIQSITGGATGFMADKGWLFGVIIAVLIGLVIIGGIRSIAKVTSKLVPFMAIIYLISALLVLVMNIGEVPAAFGLIFSSAFSAEGITGGVIGVLITGFQRAAFSNEAGIGSASIAHSAVKTNHPVTEGLVALYEPFIDTIVICTMTALVIIITGVYDNTSGLSGVELTSSAFASVFTWFPYILTLAVLLFAFSTMLSWSYYGLKAWTYLFGHNRFADLSFKLLFLAFVVLGASTNLTAVVGFSDAMIFAMSVPNMIGLYILVNVVKKELDDYYIKIKK